MRTGRCSRDRKRRLKITFRMEYSSYLVERHVEKLAYEEKFSGVFSRKTDHCRPRQQGKHSREKGGRGWG